MEPFSEASMYLEYPEKVSGYVGVGREVIEEDMYAYTYVYEDALGKSSKLVTTPPKWRRHMRLL